MSFWGTELSYQGGQSAPGEITVDPSYTSSHTVINPANALASFSLENDGDIERHNGNVGEWVDPVSAADAFECFATLDSGTLSSGTTGSWLSLGTTRTWAKTQLSIGTSVAQITIQIREINNPATVLATFTVTLTAEVDSGL